MFPCRIFANALLFQCLSKAFLTSPTTKLKSRVINQLSVKFDYDEVISPLIKSIEPSKTIEVHSLTKEMEAKGEPVVSLCVGEPDFQPPLAVIEATAKAARDGNTKYTAVAGVTLLRELICEDLKRRKNVSYDSTDIVVGSGAKQEVYQSILAVVRHGDEVIIPSPYWPSYPEIVKMAGGVPIILKTDVSNDFLIDPNLLRKSINHKTRMLIFCNPSNPTGSVHSREQCEELASVLKEEKGKNVLVLADEIYERIVYDIEHVSFPSIQGMKERTILINGFSKSHAMTGYRIGYMAAPREIVRAVTTIQGQITSCASSISQIAAIAALKVPDDVMDESIQIMKDKRNFVIEELRKIENVKISLPRGAFYVLPDISYYFHMTASDGTKIVGANDFCLYFLRVHRVAVVTGEAFGYENGFRISYATSMDDLAYSLQQLKVCLGSLK